MENVKKAEVQKFLSRSIFWTHSTLDWTNFCEYTKSIYSTNVFMITGKDLNNYIKNNPEWKE
jgi:hypothetical protein